jgi:hypothetical protein
LVKSIYLIIDQIPICYVYEKRQSNGAEIACSGIQRMHEYTCNQSTHGQHQLLVDCLQGYSTNSHPCSVALLAASVPLAPFRQPPSQDVVTHASPTVARIFTHPLNRYRTFSVVSDGSWLEPPWPKSIELLKSSYRPPTRFNWLKASGHWPWTHH